MGDWPAATVVHGDIATLVRNLKDTTGVAIIVWGSIGLTQELLKHDLVDELNLFVCPTVLGGGRQLLPQGTPSHWQLLSAQSFENGMANPMGSK